MEPWAPLSWSLQFVGKSCPRHPLLDTGFSLQSVTFDPFMYLSVPIPIRNEKMVAVVLLPRIRTRDIVGSGTGGNAGEHGAGRGVLLTMKVDVNT